MNFVMAQYPIGVFVAKDNYTKTMRDELIEHIALAPQQLRNALAVLTPEQLDAPCRASWRGETIWSPRQIAQHLSDAHLNPYIRFQQALTSDAPLVNNFFEGRWLPYQSNVPLEVALSLFSALHQRWEYLLRLMTEEDFARTFVHSEIGPQRLDVTLARYAWHGAHHIAQIQNAAK